MFETLEDVPWGRLHHAYHRAVDAPGWIRALDSESAEERTEAINHFLWSCAFHQGTLYTSTPFVIRFVIEALDSPTLAERDDGMGHPMKWQLIQFLRACAEQGQQGVRKRFLWPSPKAPTIEEAILRGRPLYERYAGDANEDIRSDAEWLLSFCSTQSQVT
jgi:hypothetical protein